MTKIIDGKALAETVVESVARQVGEFETSGYRRPGLAVVLVGEDPASQVYVRNKIRTAEKAGIISFKYQLSADVSQDCLLELIGQLNINNDIHGILVQLPLPKTLDEKLILEKISVAKDVDGFHPLNVGALSAGLPSLIPCTPQGCMLMLNQQFDDLSGKHAVVIGRSNIVGKPMAALLTNAHCTVTVVHSRTENIEQYCAQADIVIAAVGQPGLVKSHWLKQGVVVIDVGINAVNVDGKSRLVGDVDFENCLSKASAITPVPGGVGPMTIACLMQNTLLAAKRQSFLVSS
jgi:methylenetetrahydrofolate dehydrogenase (NADP+)/methenyltetrahydrofolate cyclohydrolase